MSTDTAVAGDTRDIPHKKLHPTLATETGDPHLKTICDHNQLNPTHDTLVTAETAPDILVSVSSSPERSHMMLFAEITARIIVWMKYEVCTCA